MGIGTRITPAAALTMRTKSSADGLLLPLLSFLLQTPVTSGFHVLGRKVQQEREGDGSGGAGAIELLVDQGH